MIGWRGRKLSSAGYNFVPHRQDFVFLPDWAAQVSHDVPLKDGVSGVLHCTLTTETRTYVRNGIDAADRETARRDPAFAEFFEVDGRCVIPGASIRGMLRNVIEIASFGKLAPRVDDHRYSVRDLDKKLYVAKVTKGVRCGWLSLNTATGRTELTPCEWLPISFDELEAIKPVDFHLAEGRTNAQRNQAWPDRQVHFVVIIHGGIKKAKLATPGPDSTKGTLVLTGHPGPWAKRHHEHVFYTERPEDRRPVDKTVLETFKFIHSDESGKRPNSDWAYWQGELDAGRKVPVFFHGEVERPTSMGLTRLYRLAYDHSVHDAIAGPAQPGRPRTGDHFSSAPDLADLLFGYVPSDRDTSEHALKGRVHISHAVATAAARQLDVITTVLGGPKPTFYPNYLEQRDGAPEYATFMDPDARIRGWKRYPARIREEEPPEHPDAKEKQKTRFRPLEPGAVFSFAVRFHNLRPDELGALLWSMTWGGDASLRHAIGMAKAYGFGRCRIDVDWTGSEVRWNDGRMERADWAGQFVKTMTEATKSRFDWRRSEQVIQLLAMADPRTVPLTDVDETDPVQAQQRKYRQMKVKEPAEFAEVKQARSYLRPHVDAIAVIEQLMAARLQTRLNQFVSRDKSGQFLRLLAELREVDSDELAECDVKESLGDIFNIGNVQDFLDVATRLPDGVRRAAARHVLKMLKRKDDWSEERRARFEALERLAR